MGLRQDDMVGKDTTAMTSKQGVGADCFHICLTTIPCFVVSQAPHLSLYSHTVGLLKRDDRDGWDGIVVFALTTASSTAAVTCNGFK